MYELVPLLVALALPYLVKTSLVPLTGRDATPDVSASFKYQFSSTSKFNEMEMEIAVHTAGLSQEV